MPSKPVKIDGVMTWSEGTGIWGPTDPRPTPPIYILPPGSISDGVPSHPIYIPVYPAHPIVLPPDSIAPGVPAHPIVIPPGIWGPTDPRPTHPITIPPGALGDGKPEHPIYLPPYVDNSLPPHVDNSLPGDQPIPAHPIVIPPDAIAPGVPAHPIFLPPVISGPPGPWPTPPIHIPPGSLGPCVPTHPIVLPPLPVPPGTPSHPIYLPPYVDNSLPGAQPKPEHPIFIPTPPLGFWGGAGEPFPTPPIYIIPPDFLAPGVPTHPIVLPGVPTHPIVLPGDPGWPDVEPPDLEFPVGPGGPETPGISQPVAGIPGPNGMLVFYWVPSMGWVAVPAGGPGSVGSGENLPGDTPGDKLDLGRPGKPGDNKK